MIDYRIHLIGGKIENIDNLKKPEMSSCCKFEQSKIEINLDFAVTIVKQVIIKISGMQTIFVDFISNAREQNSIIREHNKQIILRSQIYNGTAYQYMQQVSIPEKLDRIKLTITRANESRELKIYHIGILTQATLDQFNLNPTFSSHAGSHSNFTNSIQSGRDPIGRPIERTQTNYTQQRRAVYNPPQGKSKQEQEEEDFKRAVEESMKGVDKMQVEEEIFQQPKKQFEENKYPQSLGYQNPQAKIYGLKNNNQVQEWKRPEKKERNHSYDDNDIRLDLMMKLTPADIDPKFWEFHRALEKSRGRKNEDLLENNFYK